MYMPKEQVGKGPLLLNYKCPSRLTVVKMTARINLLHQKIGKVLFQKVSR